MKYLLFIVLSFSNFSCSASKTSSQFETLTVHCQVSPDTWKRYSVTVNKTSPLSNLKAPNGTWRFATQKETLVYSTICHAELWSVGTITTCCCVFVNIYMFNYNFSIIFLVFSIFFLTKYQSNLKVGTYFCFKAHELVYFSSKIPTKKYHKCFYTKRFTNAQQGTIQRSFERKSRSYSRRHLP